MDLQDVFDRSKVLYLDIIEDITNMAKTIAEIMHKSGKEFDPKITVVKFDIILQYSLLQLACSDYDLANNEIIFIKDLTKYADYCAYISSVANNKITWDDLVGSKASSVKGLLDATDSNMRELSEEVINVFAICDKNTEYDYFSDLKENIFGIMAGLAVMDGDAKSEDYTQKLLIFEVLARIEKILKD